MYIQVGSRYVDINWISCVEKRSLKGEKSLSHLQQLQLGFPVAAPARQMIVSIPTPVMKHSNMYSNLFQFFGIILSSSFSNNINMLHFSFIICLICWFSASAHLIHSNYSMILWWILNYSYPHTGTWGKPKQSNGMKVTLRISLPFEEWGLFIENKRKHSLCWFWGVLWMGMMGRGWPYVWVVLKVKAKAKKKDTTRVETWRCILCLAGCSVRLSVFS